MRLDLTVKINWVKKQQRLIATGRRIHRANWISYNFISLFQQTWMCFSIQLRGFFPQIMKFQRIGEIIFALIDRTSLTKQGACLIKTSWQSTCLLALFSEPLTNQVVRIYVRIFLRKCGRTSISASRKNHPRTCCFSVLWIPFVCDCSVARQHLWSRHLIKLIKTDSSVRFDRCSTGWDQWRHVQGGPCGWSSHVNKNINLTWYQTERCFFYSKQLNENVGCVAMKVVTF